MAVVSIANRYWLGQSLTPALIVAAVGLRGLSTAVAGECSVGKMETNVRPPLSHAGKGVTDTLLAVDLEKEPANIKERQLRFRSWGHSLCDAHLLHANFDYTASDMKRF